MKRLNSCRQIKDLPADLLRKACLLALLFSIACCKKKEAARAENEVANAYLLDVPKGFPYPFIPEDNPLTKEKIELGKKLFFDPILSRDQKISCGSCHEQGKHFTDNLKVSVGIEGRKGTRNAPSLVNIAYASSLFWDGGNPALEQQVIAPIENPNEMDFDVNKVVFRLQQNADYVALFESVFQQGPTVFTLTRAIAAYERSLISGNSRFDDYLLNSDTNALTVPEKNGMRLFLSERGECFHCHSGYNFTDQSFRNNGLYTVYPDSGRQRITLNAADHGKFRVPSLRNISKTAPYMHDGSIATLEEVIDHYAEGGKQSPAKSFLIQKLDLSKQEKQELVSFLNALTDK